MIGIGPHSDSNKQIPFEGGFLINDLEIKYDHNPWSWVIFAAIIIAWILFVAFGLHKWLVNCFGSAYMWASVLIWLLLTIILILLGTYLLVPYLNREFGKTELLYFDDSTPGPEDVERKFLVSQDSANLISIWLLFAAAMIAFF